jgi:hypothetical protein
MTAAPAGDVHVDPPAPPAVPRPRATRKETAMQAIEFYRVQALDMRQQAEAAALPSVRERCERAASAWEAMIDRAEKFEAQKAVNLKGREAN